MTTPPAFYHALLRPVVLQILRATGYYACRPAVLDTFTDLAARYLYMLAEKTAQHAEDNEHAELPSIVDVRMALQDVSALIPERVLTEQLYLDVEDTRGMDEFLAWFSGPRNKLIRDYAAVDGDPDATDYLSGSCQIPDLTLLELIACMLTCRVDSPQKETQQDRRRFKVSFDNIRQGQ